MTAALASGAPAAVSRDRESGVRRAFVSRRNSVRSVAQGDDDTDSLFVVSTLTNGVSVTRAIAGSRMARRQTSKSGNMETAGRAATNVAIVRPNAEITAGLVRAFDCST